MAKRFVLLCGLLWGLTTAPSVCRAQSSQESPSPGSPAHLGKVDFPTSCSAQTQPIFEKAVALMHSFQYQEAQQTFDEAASREPQCAMAHWGKAMVQHEQLWTLPDKKALNTARKECERTRLYRRRGRVLPEGLTRQLYGPHQGLFGGTHQTARTPARRCGSRFVLRALAVEPGRGGR